MLLISRDYFTNSFSFNNGLRHGAIYILSAFAHFVFCQ